MGAFSQLHYMHTRPNYDMSISTSGEQNGLYNVPWMKYNLQIVLNWVWWSSKYAWDKLQKDLKVPNNKKNDHFWLASHNDWHRWWHVTSFSFFTVQVSTCMVGHGEITNTLPLHVVKNYLLKCLVCHPGKIFLTYRFHSYFYFYFLSNITQKVKTGTANCQDLTFLHPISICGSHTEQLMWSCSYW